MQGGATSRQEAKEFVYDAYTCIAYWPRDYLVVESRTYVHILAEEKEDDDKSEDDDDEEDDEDDEDEVVEKKWTIQCLFWGERGGFGKYTITWGDDHFASEYHDGIPMSYFGKDMPDEVCQEISDALGLEKEEVQSAIEHLCQNTWPFNFD